MVLGKFEHGGDVYAVGRDRGCVVGELHDYSANINPLGLSPKVRAAVCDAIDTVVHYPDVGTTLLKEAIAKRYGTAVEQAVVGNGAAELLYVLCHSLRPGRVLIPAPSFSEYERAARAAGATVEYCYLQAAKGFRISPQKLASQIPAGGIVFLANPNNPTGQLMTHAEVRLVVAAAAERRAVCLVDESFLDFLPEEEQYSCRDLLDQYPNLVVLRSLTKFHALPGLRLGFCWAGEAIRHLLHAGKDQWNVNSLAQAAGVAALGDEEYRERTLTTVAAARQAFLDDMARLPGLAPLPSQANFLLVNVAGTGYTSTDLRTALAARNVLIRDCANYPGLSPGYIRLAVRLPAENRLVADALAALIKGGDTR